MPSVSVIIPVCNAEKHLDQCLESVTNQTYTDLEIILVNNGPEDSGGEICDRWAKKDSRIKVVHKQKGNVSSARNAGLDAAAGKYIIFSEVCGIHDADVLNRCMSQIAAHSPDMLVCAINTSAEDRHSRLYIDGNMYTRSEYTENIARYISTGIGFSAVTNKIFAAHIVQGHNLRFSEDMPLVADELFNCRCFTVAGHIRCTGEILCCGGDNTAETTCTADYLSQGKEYSQKLIDAVQSKGLYGAASRAIAENYQKILYRYLVLLCTDDSISPKQRTEKLEQLARSSDSAPLMMYLAALPGVKNKSVYHMFRLRQWKLLTAVMGSH